MLSLGVGELLVIGAVLVIFVGPDRLPHLMRWAGRTYGQVRRAADDMRRAFVLEADRQDAEERYKTLLSERQRLRAEREAKEGQPESDEVEAEAVAFVPDLPPAAAPTLSDEAPPSDHPADVESEDHPSPRLAE